MRAANADPVAADPVANLAADPTAPREAAPAIGTLLRDEAALDLSLPDGSRLYLERAVPFLTLYHEGAADVAVSLHADETAYCTVPGEASGQLRDLLHQLLGQLAERFGSALLIEVWVDTERSAPGLSVYAPPGRQPAVAEALRQHLAEMSLDFAPSRPGLSVALADAAPEGARLCGTDDFAHDDVLVLGLGVNGFFLDERRRPYPRYLQRLRRELQRALRRTYFEFVRLETTASAAHFHELGPRRVDALVWEIDRRLVEIASGFEFLLLVSATNDEAARAEFEAAGLRGEPHFRYRFLPVDPEPLKRALFELPIERVRDPTLAFILRDKRDETFLMLDMLERRGTRGFLYGSMQVFGGVEDELLEVARALLTAIEPGRGPGSVGHTAPGGGLGAEEFYRACQRELDYLRAQYPRAETRAVISEDVSGLLVSQGVLHVGAHTRVPAHRAEALIQHEVGTHVLTYWNGRAQPLSILHSGTPGYEDLQEGLAVLAEWFVGGLTAGRLRTLAARVVAIDHMLRGHSFEETFHLVHGRYRVPVGAAFESTARAFRCGGFTKDAVYLRGLIELLRYVREGGRLEPLFIGKIRLAYVPYVDELTRRGVLAEAPLTPRYFADDRARGHPKLRQLERGLSVFDLIPPAHERATPPPPWDA